MKKRLYCVEPRETKITLKTSYLKNIEQEIRKDKLNKINKWKEGQFRPSFFIYSQK